MRRTLISGALAGLLAYAWSAVSWLAIPAHARTLHALSAGPTVAPALKSTATRAAVYNYPGTPANDAAVQGTRDERAWLQRWTQGPAITFMVVLPDGADPNSPGPYVRALLLNVGAGLMFAWLLAAARGIDITPRLGAVCGLAAGAFAGAASLLSEASFYHFPADYTTWAFADLLIGWMIGGAVAGLILSRAAPRAALRARVA